MNRYKTPAGNEYSEQELRAKYGDQFDSLVADGTLVLVGSSEKKIQTRPQIQIRRWKLRNLLPKRKNNLALRIL